MNEHKNDCNYRYDWVNQLTLPNYDFDLQEPIDLIWQLKLLLVLFVVNFMSEEPVRLPENIVNVPQHNLRD